MHLVGADVLHPETIGGTLKIPPELLDDVEVGLLSHRRKLADRHVLAHATTKRADLGYLETCSLTVGCNAQILSESRPITRPRPSRRDYRLRSILKMLKPSKTCQSNT